MDESVAKLILSSLCQRAVRSSEPIVLTSAELTALNTIYGGEAELNPASATIRTKPDETEVAPETPFSPDVTWQPDAIQLDNHLLCIDFGTSFSKAFVCIDEASSDTPSLVDVTFGRDAQEQAIHLLPSELFIYKDEIFFGAAARYKFDLVEADQDSLIDNPKQYMTLGHDISELNQKPLRAEQDKKGLFTQRDVLVLYLAHFMHKVNLSLHASNCIGDCPLRYTHPAWDKVSAAANGKAMARIVTEAMAIAKAYPNEIEEKTSIDRALSLANAAKTIKDDALPFTLLRESVREATAAGAGALLDTNAGQRQAFVILDIGAGTSDVAGCLCVKNNITEQVVVAEVVPAAKAIPQAGNIIDNALLKLILEESNLAHGTTEYERTRQSLRKSIRTLKETLFNDGFVIAQLATGDAVEIDLSAFLKTKPMVNLYGKIQSLVSEAALLVCGQENTVYLVPTGGGARLPLIDSLVEQSVRGDDGKVLQLKVREAMPQELKAPYPALVPIYPQLAVAIGGALPTLPKQINSTREGVTDPGKTTLGTIYRS